MKRVYQKLLKKLSVRDIEEMRVFKRVGKSSKWIADKYGVNVTTVDWHTGDLGKSEYIEII